MREKKRKQRRKEFRLKVEETLRERADEDEESETGGKQNFARHPRLSVVIRNVNLKYLQ